MRLLPPSARERRATVRLLETTNLLSRAYGSETTTTRADAKVVVDDLKLPVVSALCDLNARCGSGYILMTPFSTHTACEVSMSARLSRELERRDWGMAGEMVCRAEAVPGCGSAPCAAAMNADERRDLRSSRSGLKQREKGMTPVIADESGVLRSQTYALKDSVGDVSTSVMASASGDLGYDAGKCAAVSKGGEASQRKRACRLHLSLTNFMCVAGECDSGRDATKDQGSASQPCAKIRCTNAKQAREKWTTAICLQREGQHVSRGTHDAQD